MQNRIRSSLGLGCAVYLLSSCMLMLLPLEGCQNLFLAAGYSLQSSVKCDGFWCCGVSCFCFVIGIGFSTFGIICDLQISDLTSAWNPIFLAFLYDKPCPFAVFTYVFQSYLQFHCFYFLFSLVLFSFSLFCALSCSLWSLHFSQPLQSLLLSGSAFSSLTFMWVAPSPLSAQVRRCVFFLLPGRHMVAHRRCLCLHMYGVCAELLLLIAVLPEKSAMQGWNHIWIGNLAGNLSWFFENR